MTDLGTPPVAPPTFRFLRSRTDRRVGGVAGGLAVAAGLDPAVVRVALVLAAFTGWGILAYLVAWVVVPAEDPAAGRLLVPAPEGTARFIKIGLAVVGALGALDVVGGLIGLTVGSLGLLGGPGFGWGRHGHDLDIGPGGLLGLALVAWGAVALLRRRGAGEVAAAGTPPPSPPPPSPSTSPALPPVPGAVAGPPRPAAPPSGGGGRDFLLLLARVAGWLIALWYLGGVAVATVLWSIGALDLRWPLLLAAATVGALAVLVRALLRSRRLGALVLAATALAVPPVLGVVLGQWDGRAGYRSASPATPEELEQTYRHAVGQLDLDLSAIRIPAGTTTRVKVDMGAGEVRVTVPWDASVRVSGRVGFGEVNLLSQQQTGFGARDSASLAGAAQAGTLELEARARAGRIEVNRAPELPGGGKTLACTVPEGGGLAECRPAAPPPPGAPPAPAAYLCKPAQEKGFVTCFPATPG